MDFRRHTLAQVNRSDVLLAGAVALIINSNRAMIFFGNHLPTMAASFPGDLSAMVVAKLILMQILRRLRRWGAKPDA